MQSEFMFTSESVTEGHPDKLCDQISDAIVGHVLHRDPMARVVAECAVSTGIVFLSVKYGSTGTYNFGTIARETIRRLGYEGDAFDARTCTVMTSLREDFVPRATDERDMSEDLLDRVLAEDQATLFGYACSHTPALMPLPIWLAHRLARQLASARRNGLGYLSPDGKTQVGVSFVNGRPRRIHSVTLVAAQWRKSDPSPERLRDDLIERVIRPAFADEPIKPDDRTRIDVNPEGPVAPGGPSLHAGLTGRKTAVDTYGAFARHSGAALSGKDPTRIDRVGAYAARHAAKNVVAAGLAEQCEVHLSYSIGQSHPVSVHVETYGSSRIPEDEIARRVQRVFDFRVGAIVRDLRLRGLPGEDDGGLYPQLAVYGHMGRVDLDLPWEQTTAAIALQSG